MRLTGRWLFFFLAPGLAWVLLLLIVPQVELLRSSFMPGGRNPTTLLSLDNYRAFFGNPFVLLVFTRTALAAVLVTAAVLVLAYPVAFYLAKLAPPRWQARCLILLLVPFWSSEIVRTYAWVMILQENGLVNRLLQLLGLAREPVRLLYTPLSLGLGLAYAYILFMIMPLYANLQSLDKSLIEAAEDLGASRWEVFRRIIWPYSLPGVISGCTMVFMLSAGSFLAPTLLGGTDVIWFTELIFNQFNEAMDWPRGSAYAFVLLALTLGMIVGGARLAGQRLERVVGEE